MRIQREVEIVIELIRAAIDQKSFCIGEKEVNWDAVIKILKSHHIMNMAYFGYLNLEDQQRIPARIFDIFKEAFDLATVKEAHQYFALEEIRKSFEKEHISFIPLKGCVLKYMYPSPQMRIMSDLDILFHEEQKDKIDACLKSLGYEYFCNGDVHDVYERKPFIHIEMHRRLLSKPEKQKQYFDKIWERSHVVDGKCYENEMNLEDYYLFLLAHMAKHFLSGGTGLRSLIDFHVFYHKVGQNLNQQELNQSLKELGLDQFESFLLEIDECVFNGKEWTDQELFHVFEYMLVSGIYGIEEYGFLNGITKGENVTQNKILGKIYFIKEFVFPNHTVMENLYPWLKKYPYLLPVAWMIRIFDRIFHKTNKLKLFAHSLNNNEKLNDIQRIHKRAGLGYGKE